MPNGTLIHCALDSGSSETIWHRFLLDIDIPKDTQVELSYFASESKQIRYKNTEIDMDEFIKDETYPSRKSI